MSAKKNLPVSDAFQSGVVRIFRKAVSRKYSGFTLVELIVVITILAVLATVGFLALSGYSQDARDAAAKANVRSVYSAISSESAMTNNSPRYYVVHDAAAALTGAAVAYVDGSPVTLTGGDWDQAGTNYSAGNPDWAKLRLNPEKFRLSSAPAWIQSASAAYDPKQISIWAVDAALAPTASGRNRSASFFQVAGTGPATGLVAVSGNFPAPTAAQVSAGAVLGLVKAPTGTGALVDVGTSNVPSSGSSSSVSTASQYPGCDTPDIVLANGQKWAACNVGATKAWTGGVAITNCSAGATDCDASIRYTLGSYFQWGRNADVTSAATVAGPLAAATAASETRFITNGTFPYDDWLSTQDGNLWGGGSTSLGAGTFTGQTAGNQALMAGPCASGYHVPTQAEWWSAISSLNAGLTNAATWQNDTAVATTLKLPLAGLRSYSSAAYYVSQGTNGYYWASSPAGTYGYYVNFSATQVTPATGTARAYGFSVRCLKN